MVNAKLCSQAFPDWYIVSMAANVGYLDASSSPCGLDGRHGALKRGCLSLFFEYTLTAFWATESNVEV